MLVENRVAKPKLLDQMRGKLRIKQYAWATEKAYVNWVLRFLRFHKDRNRGEWRHPIEMGKAEVEQFLTWLAQQRNVVVGPSLFVGTGGGCAAATGRLTTNHRSL